MSTCGFNLIRNARMFFTTNVNTETGVVKTDGFTTTNTKEIQVLDGLSFSQNTTAETVTINEAGDSPTRGQRNFNTALDPVELSFSTYLRPFFSEGSTVANTYEADDYVEAEEDVLWNAFAAGYVDGSAEQIGGANAAWTKTAGVATGGGTEPNSALSFAFSGKNQLQKFGVIIVLDSTSYVIDNCVLDQASIDFGIDAIATVAWTARGSVIRAVDLIASEGSTVTFTGSYLTGPTIPVATVLDPVSAAVTDVFTAGTHGLRVGMPVTLTVLASSLLVGTGVDQYGNSVNIGAATVTGVPGDAGTDEFTLAAHGLVNDDILAVTIPGASTITGITAGNFYVVNATTNTFQLSATSGGAAIDITAAGDIDFIKPVKTTCYVIATPTAGTFKLSRYPNGTSLNVTTAGGNLKINFNADGTADEAKGKNTTAPFLANKLSVIEVLKEGINGAGSNYTLALTGGNITLSNNVTYLTPANLGVVNKPFTYFTGTRAVTGSLNCYLKTGSMNSGKLLDDLLAASANNVDPAYNLKISIGGRDLAGKTRVVLHMPATVLTIPTINTEQVVSTTVNFTAQGYNDDSNEFDICANNEITITYYSANTTV